MIGICFGCGLKKMKRFDARNKDAFTLTLTCNILKMPLRIANVKENYNMHLHR